MSVLSSTLRVLFSVALAIALRISISDGAVSRRERSSACRDDTRGHRPHRRKLAAVREFHARRDAGDLRR
jgi:hypothetical protein